MRSRGSLLPRPNHFRARLHPCPAHLLRSVALRSTICPGAECRPPSLCTTRARSRRRRNQGPSASRGSRASG
eukprot:2550283-Alexandrium_andersonii.AAC.1